MSKLPLRALAHASSGVSQQRLDNVDPITTSRGVSAENSPRIDAGPAAILDVGSGELSRLSPTRGLGTLLDLSIWAVKTVQGRATVTARICRIRANICCFLRRGCMNVAAVRRGDILVDITYHHYSIDEQYHYCTTRQFRGAGVSVCSHSMKILQSREEVGT